MSSLMCAVQGSAAPPPRVSRSSATAGHPVRRRQRQAPRGARQAGANGRQDVRQAAEQTTHPSRSRRTKPSSGGFLVSPTLLGVGGDTTERSAGSSRVRGLAHAPLVAIVIAGLALCALGGGSAAGAAQLGRWPSVQEQLVDSHVIPGSALERLILENQDFSLLRAEEANDSLRIPPWLRVLYHKNHPHDQYSPHDPT